MGQRKVQDDRIDTMPGPEISDPSGVKRPAREEIGTMTTPSCGLQANPRFMPSGIPLAQACESNSGAMAENMLSYGANEGTGAFIEQRNPHWQDQ